nr:hypothetical protein [Cytophagales bacterium]
MKRRSFLEKISAGSSAFAMGAIPFRPVGNERIPRFSYPKPESLAEVLNREGQVMLRVALSAVDGLVPQAVKVGMQVTNAAFNRIKPYYFANTPGKFDPKTQVADLFVTKNYPVVIAAWIDEPSATSAVILTVNGTERRFNLEELIKQEQIDFQVKDLMISCNYLLDKEIGELNPKDLPLPTVGDSFSIAILADTQGGNPETPKAHPTRMKIHNAFCEDSIKRVNELDPQPAFTLILGDVVDNQGEKQHFEAMHSYLKRIKSPLLYAIGNHETIYQAKFTPGYNMAEFDNYFAAQKAMNGMDLLLYSFNLGKWHFIVWPDPLRNNFFETHPHYFDWLERDLEKQRDSPVVFMQHVPMHPIGIDPLINYAESVAVKRQLLDILAKQGNVKYIFSGHVHIPIKASFKTAVEFKGMNMINLPAAGYRPRAFGEEEWHGGPSQGILVLDIEGDKARCYFKTVTEEIYPYPDKLPPFREAQYPLWLTYKWQLPAAKQIKNGSFEEGLAHWSKRFVYMEDERASNMMDVRKTPGRDSDSALYLYSRKRDYHIPGQDRLPQTINHLCQAVTLEPQTNAAIHLDYCVDAMVTDSKGWAGGFIWLEGFNGSTKLLNMAYWVGKGTSMLADKFTDNKEVPFVHMQLPAPPDQWQSAVLNWTKDYKAKQENLSVLGLDRLVVNLGTWHINDGDSQPFGIYLDNLSMQPAAPERPSHVGGIAIVPMPDKEMWWLNKYEPFVHIAGEHRYVMSTKKEE